MRMLYPGEWPLSSMALQNSSCFLIGCQGGWTTSTSQQCSVQWWRGSNAWHVARNSEGLPGSIEAILAAVIFKLFLSGGGDLHKICSHHPSWFCGRLSKINQHHLFPQILAINQQGHIIQPTLQWREIALATQHALGQTAEQKKVGSCKSKKIGTQLQHISVLT